MVVRRVSEEFTPGLSHASGYQLQPNSKSQLTCIVSAYSGCSDQSSGDHFYARPVRVVRRNHFVRDVQDATLGWVIPSVEWSI